jgi:hypothetical protein
MTDRADEIAREIADHTTEGFPLMEGEHTTEELVRAIAAALRSYGNERLEEAGQRLDEDDEYGAKVVRAFKSRSEKPT